MKKLTTAKHTMPCIEILQRLASTQMRWNEAILALNTARLDKPEMLAGMLDGFGESCGRMLAQIENDMALLKAMPDMDQIMASLVECKKMEIRRSCIAVTDYIEKHTTRRLHTQLFSAAHDNAGFGEGLDDYKDIYEELVRRLQLLNKMGIVDHIMLAHCMHELTNSKDLFLKKRLSILDKMAITEKQAAAFYPCVDEALKMPKSRMKYHQISLATFQPHRSVKYIAMNMAEFFDDLHSPNTEPMLRQLKNIKLGKPEMSSMIMLPLDSTQQRRASA